jgi:hypothetical protein
LYGFQREFAVEVDMEDFDDDQSDENVWIQITIL